MMGGASVSKLALGTAQFGMPYGIANKTGQPAAATVAAILRRASEAGIALIDTAHAYGEAEAVLGHALDPASPLRIVTKTLAIRAEVVEADAVAAVARAFRDSLNRLGRDRAYGLLVHHADDLLARGGEQLWTWLEQVRREGQAEKIGVSVYTPEQLRQVLERYPTLDLVQLPFNIYDQRFAKAGLLDTLTQRGVETHARSAFLQGLLLMDSAQLPDNFAGIRRHQAALHEHLREGGLSPLAGALAACLADARIDVTVVGCESVKQLEQILDAAAAADRLPDGLDRFAIFDERIVNPSLWAQRR